MNFDRKFIKLLLLDVFSMAILKLSSVGGGAPHNGGLQHEPLHGERLRFIYGKIKHSML